MAGASVDDVVSPVIETGLDLVRSVVGRIGKVEERVDIEGIPLAPHIGDGRRAVDFHRRTPDEEVGIFVGQIVEVEPVVQQFPLFHRMVVCHIASETQAPVVSLFAVSVVGKQVEPARHIEVPDPPCVRDVRPFIFVMSRMVVDPDIGAGACGRGESRPFRADVDHPVQCR